MILPRAIALATPGDPGHRHGTATFTVEGLDTGGTTRMQHTFDTFVGVGISNPTFAFDLPPVDAAVDAAVDAPPDA